VFVSCDQQLRFALVLLWLGLFGVIWGGWFGRVIKRVNADAGGTRRSYARGVPEWSVIPAGALAMGWCAWTTINWTTICLPAWRPTSESVVPLVFALVVTTIGIARAVWVRVRAHHNDVDFISLDALELEDEEPVAVRWRPNRQMIRNLVEFFATAITSIILALVTYAMGAG
jgi:hypothetical protein